MIAIRSFGKAPEFVVFIFPFQVSYVQLHFLSSGRWFSRRFAVSSNALHRVSQAASWSCSVYDNAE